MAQKVDVDGEVEDEVGHIGFGLPADATGVEYFRMLLDWPAASGVEYFQMRFSLLE